MLRRLLSHTTPRRLRRLRRLASTLRPAPNVHVHLVGCNGVPSAAYEPLLARLRASGAVASTSVTEVHGLLPLDDADPRPADWTACVDAVARDAAAARALVGDGPGARVVGFGHSMGGALVYVSWCAVCCVLCAVCAVCCVLCAVCCVLCAVCCVLCVCVLYAMMCCAWLFCYWRWRRRWQ